MSEKVKSGTPNSSKLTLLEKAFKEMDWGSVVQKMLWSLNPPRCICCESVYKAWLEAGKKLYGENDSSYKERVKEENFHRKRLKISRLRTVLVKK